MTNIFSCDEIYKQIEEFARLQMEYEERVLAEIITKYDFLVGSKECKYRLMEILPDDANIICSPYIEDPTMIYAIKKFDIKDLLTEPCRVLDNKENEE
jgi:hypothetical protein